MDVRESKPAAAHRGLLLTLVICGFSSVMAASRIPVQASAVTQSDSGQANCGDQPCADNGGCIDRDHKLLDIDGLFRSVAGDESPFKGLKNQKAGDLTYSAGGELRYRHMNEKNRLRPGGPGHSSYELWRFTPFVQVTHDDFIGGYVQAIDASMFGLDAPYTASQIDVNRADLLQYYAELKVAEFVDGKLKYRYGRQFLQYGGQRLLSSLGWANAFRNFEGHKLVYSNDEWDIDGFSMQSVNAAAGNNPHPYSFDHADQSRRISGFYSTWKGMEASTLDMYYLYFDESQSSAALMDGKRHTLGTRLAGKHPVKSGKTLDGTWSWDVEGAWQFGEDNFGSPVYRDVQAGMVGALGGYTFEDVTWKPGLGGIFYWGSGDSDPATGKITTFDTLYPLGHAYWGQIDNLSGQNLLDYGLQASVTPHKKLAVVSQWHYFDMVRSTDRIYNVAGAALPGSGSSNIGNELDLVGTYTYSKALNVQMGYLWFFYGDAVNSGPLARSDAEQFYLQGTYSF